MNINKIEEIISNKRETIEECSTWITKTYGVMLSGVFECGYVGELERELRYSKMYNGHLLNDQDILTMYDQCEILDKLTDDITNLIKYKTKFSQQKNNRIAAECAANARKARKQKAEKIKKKYGEEIHNLYYRYKCTDIKKEACAKDYYTPLCKVYNNPSYYKISEFDKLKQFYSRKKTKAQFLGVLNAGIQYFSTLAKITDNIYIKDTASKKILCIQ